MKLVNTELNQEVEAEIVEIEKKDFSKIKKSKEFVFDWSEEIDNSVFKIITLDNRIHGLLSITNIEDEFRIHINLIENANFNKGKAKEYENVAGCLIAFAIQISFEKGYLGFTSLVPKTELIDLYINKYGFSQFGRQLAIERREAIKLIEKYL